MYSSRFSLILARASFSLIWAFSVASCDFPVIHEPIIVPPIPLAEPTKIPVITVSVVFMWTLFHRS